MIAKAVVGFFAFRAYGRDRMRMNGFIKGAKAVNNNQKRKVRG